MVGTSGAEYRRMIPRHWSRWSAVVLVVVALTLVPQAGAQGPTITFVSVPTVVPRNTPAPNYSPLVSLHYEGLAAQTYTLKVFLLETQTGNYNCGTDPSDQMWCGATFSINNQDGGNASGTISDARVTNIHDWSGFRWVADLHNQSGAKVFTTTLNASATLNRAPVLSPLGHKSVVVGQNLDFTVSVTDPEGDSVALSADNLPPGATFSPATGQFHWQPSTAGTSHSVTFTAAQSGGVALTDSELITIEATTASTALAFDRPGYTTGESGPAALTVARTNGTSGSVAVDYTTTGLSATPGSDFIPASGTLTFADGETSKTIFIQVLNDTTIEANETFQVTLSNPSNGGTLGTPSAAIVTIVDDDDAQLAGQWSSVLAWPSVPIHMHLLPTGNVMFWDRHNHNVSPPWDVTPYLWDPSSPSSFTALPLPDGWDVFCSGHAFAADGRLLVAGGHLTDYVGAPTAGFYDPFANVWTALPNMNAGRWYPSVTTLANGDMLVLAGTMQAYGDINRLPQVLNVATGTWRDLSTALTGQLFGWPDFYPFAYQSPNGKVFIAGPQQTARYLDTAGSGGWTTVAASSLSYRDYGSSVMYGDGKVMVVGGNPRDFLSVPSASADIIDLNTPSPTWTPVSPMSVGRRHLTATIVADGQVMVTGGSSSPGFDEPAGAVRFAELWNPTSGTWTPLASHARYRGYHSSALLLPDGRVLVAGGGHPNPRGGTAESNAEIFSPPYLFKGARPTITSAPPVVRHDEQFSVATSQAGTIAAVTLIRLSSVTHAFNENQRINLLSFTASTGGLTVTAPANANISPPGHYMLFIVNQDGVPSVARIVELTSSAMRVDEIAPPARRTLGGQTFEVSGAFAGLSSVQIDGSPVPWSFSGDPGHIVVTTPAHAVGAARLTLIPASGTSFTRLAAVAFLPTTFVDDPLSVGVTTVKASHIIELRHAVAALRSVARLPPAAWTDPSLTAASTVIKATHVMELRSRLEEATAALGYPPATYTDHPLGPGTLIKRVHIAELRQRIRSLAE